MKLNDKQKRFCLEYIVDLNATQAAIRAGYSEKTAKSMGCENLTKPDIQAYVQKLMSERSKRTEITADNVLKELAKLGFGNMQNLYDNNGLLIPIHKLPSDVSATLQEIQTITTYDKDDKPIEKKRYKSADKKSSLELLGKHLKLFTEKVQHSNDPENPLGLISFYIPDNGRD